MGNKPTIDELIKALQAAAPAHHEFQENALNGQYDEIWAGWYAAYVLGRLGDFVTPTRLSEWLENVQAADDWAVAAAKYVYEQLGNS